MLVHGITELLPVSNIKARFPVKLKMAQNSLFAILLRSPWWISFAVVLVIAAVCGAFLPREVAPFGALGALPIFVIGCVAAWRQLRAPSSTSLQSMRAQAASMSWKDFSTALESAWQSEGQQVSRVQGSGQAADLRLEKNGAVTLVSARRWKAVSHGVEPLRELRDAVERQKADHGVYAVLQGALTENARAFANECGLLLLEGDALAAMLLKSRGRR